jgi:A/G-specific adenine glycosylase
MDNRFSPILVKWYEKNKRDLPWRHHKDPYKIWLSEIILQQTQVAQGLSYYIKFVEKYPTVKKLALAKEDEVFKLWQGLGYYSRARNLHASAKYIHNELQGKFPTTFEDIKNLKGVGDYTAAAIASFAYDLAHAVVDGNVYRVLSRVFGIETPIDSSGAKKEFQQLANDLLNSNNAAMHNQAIMEFGSQYCKPNNPNCESCVLNANCYAYKTNKVTQLPIKLKKTKIRNRFFNYVILIDKNKNILIHKRKEGDIWQSLYEFYLIETEKEISSEQLLDSKDFRAVCKSKFDVLFLSKQYKHILSHQHLYAKFYVVKTSQTFKLQQTKCNLKTLKNYAFPRLIEKFLNDCVLKELF